MSIKNLQTPISFNRLLNKTIYLSITIIAVLFLQSSSAQTVVTIGSAVSTTTTSGLSSTTTAGDRNERHMCIYSAAELTAAGMTTGTSIMSIAWEKTGSGFYYDQNLTIRVWLKHNVSTTFPASPTFSTETSSATMVFETSTGAIPTAAGWLSFSFNTATPFFVWDGTQNIQVITELIRPTDWTATGFNWRTISTLTNAAANANGTSAAPPGTLTRTGTRPQIRLGIPTTGNDAALVGMSSPVSGPAGVQNINVQLRNTGNTTLVSADIGWTLNGGPSTNFPWTGSLAPGNIATVTVGSPNFSNGNHTVIATVSNPNGSPDADPANNVVSKSFQICSALSGAYIIDKTLPTSGNNFNSFNDFSNALSSCGVAGNVTATVTTSTGPYNEQVVFQNIPGIGAGATVTIEGNGETIVSDTAIIQTGSNPNRHIIRLNSLQYFTVNNLHIDMFPGSTAFIGVHVLNSGNNMTISNCVVNMGTATSSLIGAFIVNGDASGNLTPGGMFDNITITGNTVTGGGYGASVNGLASPLATNVVISNNNFNDFNSNGVYLRETNGAEVRGNHFDKSAGTTSSVNAIQLAQALNVNGRVSGNYIRMSQTTGSLVGIYLFNGTGHRVFNNLIYDIRSTTGNIEGIRVRTGGTAPEIYFNTISFENASATTGSLRGFREELSNTGSILRNNIFSITQTTSSTKSAIELASSSGITTAINSNYNVFWMPGGNVGMRGTTAYATLNDWQTASTQDANSFETDPFFQSVSNPIPTSGVINNQAITGTNVLTDITGATRGAAPDPGAYEFSPPAGDAAITNFVLPPIPHCATTLAVQFVLTNAGSDPLNTVTINWTVNGVPQPVVNWAGPSLASGASTTVTLGTVPVTGSNVYSFTATSSLPNGNPDINPGNDSFTFSGFRRGFEGVFTINQAAAISSTNYQTFQSIANDLSQHGVCAPVTINVMSGPYTEQVVFNTIPGSSSLNTITLDGNSQVLQYNPIIASNDHILQLNGVNYMIVQNLIVNSLHATQGRGIHITNAASKIVIRNNAVNVSTTNSVSSCFGIIISGANWLLNGSLSDSVVITGNTVTGGYSAIQLSGEHWTQPLTRITVANNTILDWYGFGVYLSYTNGAKVSKNIIRRPTRTNSGSDAVTPAGITVPAGSLTFLLEKNRIYDLHMNMPQHPSISRGIHMSGTITAPTSGTIQNNLIYGMNNDGAQYGIQNNSVNGPVNIYHNTIVLNSATGASTSNTNAINLSNSTLQGDIDMRNNIFVVTRGGTGIKRIIDVAASSLSFISNYNAAWLNAPGGTSTYGQVGSTNYNTLGDWQTGTGRDINSVHADPLFVNPAVGNFTPTNIVVDGGAMGTSQVGGIIDDFFEVIRSANPDPGAIEFIPPPCTTANGGIANTTSGPFCTSGSGTITATGYSTGAGITYQWQYSDDNFVSNINNLVGQTNPASAATGTITATTYYRLRVTCVNGPVIAYSNIVLITINSPVVINTHPASQTVCSGSNVTFTVAATGSNLTYQWRKGTVNIGGATSSSYTITGVVTGDAGSYDVVITGSCGTLTSNAAVLTVNAVTAISVQPASQSVCVGSNVTFSVTASGTALTYQWRKNGSNIGGATVSSYTINNVSAGDAGNYDVVVTGTCGTVPSASATLSVTATGSWIGVVSSNWNTAGNWCGGVPTVSTDIVIPASAPNMPNLSGGVGAARNITINSGASLTIGAGGTLDIYGNVVNNGIFNATAGNLGFRGTASQSIPAFTTINVTMNGNGGIILGGNASITGTLTLTTGNITLGTNNLLLANSSTGSIASHIITNGTGNVMVQNLAASSSRTVPVGINVSSYNPVILSANAGHPTDNFMVNIKQGVYVNGLSGVFYTNNVVDRTWTINEATAGGSNLNITFQWTGAEELTSFQRNRSYIMRFNGTNWVAGPATGASGSNPYIQTLNGVTSFSPFAVRTEPIPRPSTGIYPNPAIKEINVVLDLSSDTPITFSIYDSKGRLVKQEKINVAAGLSKTTLDIEKLSSGVYVIKLSSVANPELLVQKFVKSL